MTRLQHMTGCALWVLVGAAAPANAKVVAEWNVLAVQCLYLGLPGTPTADPISPSRPGPPGAPDLAIVVPAMHDAVQAIEKKYEPYKAGPSASGRESVASAAAAAAHRVLVTICPNYKGSLTPPSSFTSMGATPDWRGVRGG